MVGVAVAVGRSMKVENDHCSSRMMMAHNHSRDCDWDSLGCSWGCSLSTLLGPCNVAAAAGVDDIAAVDVAGEHIH